jgi:hypothetical protein
MTLQESADPQDTVHYLSVDAIDLLVFEAQRQAEAGASQLVSRRP